MDSRLYRGWIAHERKTPRKNSFRYQVYYLFARLDELPELDRGLRWFSHNRRNLVSLQDRDHGPRDGSALQPWIESLCSQAGIDLPGGSYRLLTFPRVAGFKFFPVAFWYCYDSSGICRAVLAEVNNTFGEHHNYFLHCSGEPFDWHSKTTRAKVLHVSPFISMRDARYEFRLTEPAEKLRVAIYDYVDGPLTLVAALDLDAVPLDDRSLLRTVFGLGPISARAWLLIHFQALRIISKGIRYIPKPKPPAEETSFDA